MEEYVKHNERTISRWCREGWEWSRPVTPEQVERARRGEAQIYLTPVKPVPQSWLEDLCGKRVLALASGGGQQGPLLTALGASVTVMDLSTEQLRIEREVQLREGYDIQLVQADMTQPFPFADGAFDVIVHPVSNVYIEKVEPVWRECFRVLASGGLLMAGLDNGVNFIVDEEEQAIVGRLPFNPLRNPDQYQMCMREDLGFQFSHGLQEQIGGQLKCGFQLEDLYEDTNNVGRLYERNIPTYFATLARKP